MAQVSRGKFTSIPFTKGSVIATRSFLLGTGICRLVLRPMQPKLSISIFHSFYGRSYFLSGRKLQSRSLYAWSHINPGRLQLSAVQQTWWYLHICLLKVNVWAVIISDKLIEGNICYYQYWMVQNTALFSWGYYQNYSRMFLCLFGTLCGSNSFSLQGILALLFEITWTAIFRSSG